VGASNTSPGFALSDFMKKSLIPRGLKDFETLEFRGVNFGF